MPPPTQTQYQQYLSCYWPDFDETLKVGSWEHLEQIQTGRVPFVPVICPYQEYLNYYWHNLDQILKAMSRQGQGKVNASSREGKGKIRARSMEARSKVKARLGRYQGNGKAMSRQC